MTGATGHAARKWKQWLPGAATGLAALSCYGTTLAVWLLSLLGLSITIDAGVWAGAIAGLAVVAAGATIMVSRRLGAAGPAVSAAGGLVLILWALFGHYSRITEALGFVFLVLANVWTWRARTRGRIGRPVSRQL
jgi:hypothetical protein